MTDSVWSAAVGVHSHDCVDRGCRYVEGEDLRLLVEVALGVVKRRRLRGQSRVYEVPVDIVEGVAKKYVVEDTE